MTTMSATEVSRSFSEVLNRVASGEEVEVVRHGMPVARITGVRPTTLSAEAFREMILSAPRADAAFADDVLEARLELPPMDDPWQS